MDENDAAAHDTCAARAQGSKNRIKSYGYALRNKPSIKILPGLPKPLHQFSSQKSTASTDIAPIYHYFSKKLVQQVTQPLGDRHGVPHNKAIELKQFFNVQLQQQAASSSYKSQLRSQAHIEAKAKPCLTERSLTDNLITFRDRSNLPNGQFRKQESQFDAITNISENSVYHLQPDKVQEDNPAEPVWQFRKKKQAVKSMSTRFLLSKACGSKIKPITQIHHKNNHCI